MLCINFGKWVHGRCANLKIVTLTLAADFICERCVIAIKGVPKSVAELTFYEQVELVYSFCYMWDRLNASGRRKVAASTRIGWIKFSECGNCLTEEGLC